MKGFTSLIGNRSSADRRDKSETVNELAYSIHSWKHGAHSPYAVFYIGANIAKEARFILGDRVDVGTSDCGRFGLISRTNESGRKLSPGSGNKRSTTRLRVQFKIPNKNYPFHITRITTLQNVTVKNEGILFEWPPEA